MKRLIPDPKGFTVPKDVYYHPGAEDTEGSSICLSIFCLPSNPEGSSGTDRRRII